MWDDTDTWTNTFDAETYQDPSDITKVWLPALSIPIRNKSSFKMPEWHMQAMVADLEKVTTVIAVGWRARENHFLRLLFQHLPRRDARLVAVSGDDTAAMETVDNLWPIGRFGSYTISGVGFSGFTRSATAPFTPRPNGYDGHTPLTLDHVLSARPGSGVWTDMEPGRGPAEPEATAPLLDPGYVELYSAETSTFRAASIVREGRRCSSARRATPRTGWPAP